MTEQEIVNGVKNRDRKAMRAMYDLLAGSAMATARRYLGEDDRCRDVLQDCFLKAFTRISDFDYRGDGSLRAWMMRQVVWQMEFGVNPSQTRGFGKVMRYWRPIRSFLTPFMVAWEACGACTI